MEIKRPNQLLKNVKKTKKKNLRYIILSAGLLFLTAAILFFLYVFEGLVSLEELENPKAQLASNVYSIDGELIDQFYNENRVEVSIDSIPSLVINALIATEDKNFYDHWGVDLQRFIKAMIKNVVLFRREGASTITMQLAKNLYGFKAKNENKVGTVIRKIREWITAVQIEKTYTKPEILEMYFNISYFGRSAYGIAMASKIYFDKDVKDLSVQDAGILVSLLKSPGGYDPFKKYDNAFRRRNLVMQNMVDEGFLSEEVFEKIKLEKINVSYKKVHEKIYGSLAPHFVEYIRQQLERLSDKYGFDIYEGGLRIYTTLDSRMQKIANRAAQLHLDRFQKQFDASWNWNRYRAILNEVLDRAVKNRPEYKSASSPEERRAFYIKIMKDNNFVDSVKNDEKKIEVGFVAVDTKTGEILAMVGGRDTKFKYGLNHVTQIRRQPGSAFKPFIYTVAIDRGLYPAFPIENKPFSFDDGSAKPWSPANFDHSTGGFTTLRSAMAESFNLVAARLVIENDYVPLPEIGRFAALMGIKTKLNLTPAISLGTSVVTPLELVSGFATLGNKGVYNEPISILRIEDKDGVVIANFTSEAREAISEETAYIVTDMMTSVMQSGTGASARSVYNFQRPAAGKTGTNTDYADAWFIGFTPQITAGVWVGFDDQRITFTGSYGQGSAAALPIWAIFMHDVYTQINLPFEDFQVPPSGNVIQAAFCKESIFETGRPRLVSPACRTGSVTDIINVKDLPPVYDPDDLFESRFNSFPYNDTSGSKRRY